MSLLGRTAGIAEAYLASLPERSVAAPRTHAELLAELDMPLPEAGEPAEAVLDALAALGDGMMATAGPRYFGFVTGGALPVSLAADWLVSTWDGPHFSEVATPAGAAVEAVAEKWVLDVLGLQGRVGFVTGATMANLVGLAAARHRVLADVGWNVEERGLIGAPPVTVVVGDEAHVSLLKALRLLGFGSAVTRLPVDGNGAMRPEGMPLDGPAIVCAQAGNVNTGACDPLEEIVPLAREAGAWVHVDGAFGLWAAASPALRGVVAGYEGADSWALDAHKWLNVPYDCGLAIVADREAHAAAMSASADYLEGGQEGLTRTPEMSRRGRQVPVYAALRFLGRSGMAELVDRCCAHARRLADAMADVEGARVLNDVVLNQVLVSFGDDTASVIERVQRGGEAWLGGTVWQGVPAARVSFSNWSTTDADVDRLVASLAAR